MSLETNLIQNTYMYNKFTNLSPRQSLLTKSTIGDIISIEIKTPGISFVSVTNWFGSLEIHVAQNMFISKWSHKTDCYHSVECINICRISLILLTDCIAGIHAHTILRMLPFVHSLAYWSIKRIIRLVRVNVRLYYTL